MSDYNINSLQEKLMTIGVKSGDAIYCHSNIGYFGMPENIVTKEELCEKYYYSLLKAVGKDGTLVFPTYTYSFSKNKNNTRLSKRDFKNNVIFNEVFNTKNSKSNMGILSEYVRSQKNAIRTEDPFYSSVIIGKLSSYLSENISNNSFDKNSLFSRFFKINGKFLNLNFPGTTFIHYVERELSVDYRYDKEFEGEITTRYGNQLKKWIITVSDLSKPGHTHNPYHFVKYIKNNNIAKYTSLGKGEILIISAKQIFDTIRNKIKSDKWFLTNNYKSQ
tara:strand:+ start:1441 stop:2268 length:828 start_codon:yes stop_codon:yes gene_type:complete